ncbi:MAG: CDP-glucose 4,6-dehydratase, partial [Burkholderiales bacterium]
MTGQIDPDFWRRKRVLVTGHTGFKGAWTTAVLRTLGAEVFGLSLPPPTTPSLFEIMGADGASVSVMADIREVSNIACIREWRPQIVLHMAAQALVRQSYADAIGTFASNVMGTINVLETLRGLTELEAILVITTDKVYRNDDTGRAFVESDPLGGHDPYSASKAGAEIATSSYAYSFFKDNGVPVATARAGNVIGGGDWSNDRIIPDIWRANREGRPVTLRMPEAVRPWQHVLEPVAGYLMYCEALASNAETPRTLNFGPPPSDVLTVAEVTERFLGGLQSDI